MNTEIYKVSYNGRVIAHIVAESSIKACEKAAAVYRRANYDIEAETLQAAVVALPEGLVKVNA